MLTLSKLVVRQLSQLRRQVCNVIEVQQDLEVEKAKPLKDAIEVKKNESVQEQVKNVCLRDVLDNKQCEKIVQQVHQKWIRSISPSMIQDLQPMNMPNFGMKHNASNPEARHVYLKVASSLCKARLEEGSEHVEIPVKGHKD